MRRKPPLKTGKRKFKKRWPHSGFTIGKASPVLFCHHQRRLKFLVHGDDFVVPGEPVDLVWMRNELESKLEMNTTILGDEPGMSKEVNILKRKLCWHDGVGISYEADQKHAEAIIRETRASNLTSLKVTHVLREQGRKGETKQTTLWRRVNWELGMKEQPLVGQIYCAKELTRHMATPTTTDWEKVVRLGRYLKKQSQGSIVVQISRNVVST